MPYFLHRCLLELLDATDESNHRLVEISEVMVAEFLVVNKVPLSAGIFVAPAVSFSWEIYPFWVSELVSHKVEVSAVDG